jgi:hypothetical protein
MTKAQYKKLLQAEILEAGFSAIIASIGELNCNTTIEFIEPVPNDLAKWLNGRFAHGIRFLKYNRFMAIVNTPNESKLIKICNGICLN